MRGGRHGFDVVIVGGGAIGCAVAAFLLDDPGSGAAWPSSSATRRTGTRPRPSRRARSASSSRPPRTSACRGSASSSCATSRAARPDRCRARGARLPLSRAARGCGHAPRGACRPASRGRGGGPARPCRARRPLPWMRFDDVEAGSLGLGGEGWFDGFGLLQALRQRALALGAEFVRDEVVGLDRGTGRIDAVRLVSGRRLAPGRSSMRRARGRARSPRWPASNCRSRPADGPCSSSTFASRSPAARS